MWCFIAADDGAQITGYFSHRDGGGISMLAYNATKDIALRKDAQQFS
jgi:hypothetical protein